MRNTGPAPWPAPFNSKPWILAADLPALPTEGVKYHVHAHLDVFVDGERKPVAALIGIDTITRVLSPLHTHDDTGLLHIESDVARDFTIGQLFTEWAVRLDDSCVGQYCAPDTPVQWYVNGQPFTDDPNTVPIKAHEEIVVVIGSPPDQVPSSYDFPRGF